MAFRLAPRDARINLFAIVLIASSACSVWATGLIFREEKLQYTLTGGDDYELAFTAPAAAREAVQAASEQVGTPVTRIGQIEHAAGLRLTDAHGQVRPERYASLDHFA